MVIFQPAILSSFLSFSHGTTTHPKAELLEAWPQALALLDMVECKKLRLQQITYNAAIRALEFFANVTNPPVTK